MGGLRGLCRIVGVGPFQGSRGVYKDISWSFM